MKPVTGLHTHGYFSVAGGVTVVNGEYAALRRYTDGLGNRGMPVPKREWISAFSVPEVGEMPQDALDVALTQRHEQAHYRQLMSTPFGLLLWRCQNALVSDVAFLTRSCVDVRPNQNIALPIHGWFYAAGRNQLRAALEAGAEFGPERIQHTRKWTKLRETVPYLESVFNEIVILSIFVSAILDKVEMTVGDFVDVANAAFEVLQRRSDTAFSAKWATRLPAETPLTDHAENRFAGVELIESGARLEERRFLSYGAGASDRVEAWELRAIFGVYEPAYRWLMEQMEDSTAALALLDTALMSPIDPAFAGCCGSVLLVEDVLPAFRLPRLVAAAREQFWPEPGADLDEWLGKSLCAGVGLTPPAEIAAEGMRQKFSGEHSWGFDHKNVSPGERILDPGKLADYAQAKVHQAMEIRLRSASFFVAPGNNYEAAFRPLAMFYRDNVAFGLDEKTEPREFLLLALNAYWGFLHSGVVLSLIEDGDISQLRQCEEALVARMKAGFSSDQDYFHQFFKLFDNAGAERFLGSLSVQTVARTVVSQENLGLLRL